MKLTDEQIQAVGIWALRIIVAIGAVVCACLGKEAAASTMTLMVIASFFFFDL